jgi:uncharacterized protein YggU (UPF0235/DUF167 family)
VPAAPVENAANNAVIRALADALHVPKSGIRIIQGASSRNKIIEVALCEQDVIDRLAPS